MNVVRRARSEDAAEAAGLLHDFNIEFGTPSPGPVVLRARLQRLLAGEGMVALLSHPDTAIALLSVRPNVWYSGPVLLLDELYVRPTWRGRGIGGELLEQACAIAMAYGAELLEIDVDEPDVDARRFYEAHGFSCTEPESGTRSLYYWRNL